MAHPTRNAKLRVHYQASAILVFETPVGRELRHLFKHFTIFDSRIYVRFGDHVSSFC